MSVVPVHASIPQVSCPACGQGNRNSAKAGQRVSQFRGVSAGTRNDVVAVAWRRQARVLATARTLACGGTRDVGRS